MGFTVYMEPNLNIFFLGFSVTTTKNLMLNVTRT